MHRMHWKCLKHSIAPTHQGEWARARRACIGTQNGFTLIELLIVVAIVGIIAAIAYPAYTTQIASTKRKSAAGCLSEQVGYMERFYTTNLRYDEDRAGNANPLSDGSLVLDCMTNAQTGNDYNYSVGSLTRSQYTLSAAPKGAQASRDGAKCGTLTLDHRGTRGAGGPIEECW